MKKFIILAAAALAASAACTKVENALEPQKEVSFQVANYVPQTKAAGDKIVYPTSNTFGTYAWATGANATGTSDASDHTPFMVNETVGFVDPVWKTTVHTFYWPKTGTMDFISYSPFNGTNATADSNPSVDQTHITYSNIVAGDIDYMYADKVTCTNPTANTQAGNLTIEKNEDGSAYTGAQYAGVPTLFRHALAKVSFKVKANFLEWGSGSDKTTWKVTIMDFKVGSLYNKGDLHLTWDAGEWKPANTNRIWDVLDLSSKTADQDLADDVVLTTDYQDLSALTASYVIPQQIIDGAQKVYIKAKIETTNAANLPLVEYYEDTFDLSAISSIGYIKMNQIVVFNVSFKPTANVSTPDSPEDVIINFDPAVSDWETVTANINIQL